MKAWIEIYKRWHSDDYDIYPRHHFVIIKSYNGRILMQSKGSRSRTDAKILAMKIAKHTNLEFRCPTN